MHTEVPWTLELDPEQRPQGHACGCSGQHAQHQIAVVVSVPLTNDDLVGRLLSIKPCIRVLMGYSTSLTICSIDNLSSWWVCSTVWTIAICLLRGRCSICCVRRWGGSHSCLIIRDFWANISCVCPGILECKFPGQTIIWAFCTKTWFSHLGKQCSIQSFGFPSGEYPDTLSHADVDAVHWRVDLSSTLWWVWSSSYIRWPSDHRSNQFFQCFKIVLCRSNHPLFTNAIFSPAKPPATTANRNGSEAKGRYRVTRHHQPHLKTLPWVKKGKWWNQSLDLFQSVGDRKQMGPCCFHFLGKCCMYGSCSAEPNLSYRIQVYIKYKVRR